MRIIGYIVDRFGNIVGWVVAPSAGLGLIVFSLMLYQWSTDLGPEPPWWLILTAMIALPIAGAVMVRKGKGILKVLGYIYLSSLLFWCSLGVLFLLNS